MGFSPKLDYIRTHLGEESVNALLWMVCSIKEMAILHVNVCSSTSILFKEKHFVFWFEKEVIFSWLLLTAYGPARCSLNQGGCWSETKKGLTFSACSVIMPYSLKLYIQVSHCFLPFSPIVEFSEHGDIWMSLPFRFQRRWS